MAGFCGRSDGIYKYFSFGITCTVYGKDISRYITTTENGRITVKILVNVSNILIHLIHKIAQKLSLFAAGLPCHGSRFAEDFLTYVNTIVHKFLCIGIPYSGKLQTVLSRMEC